MVFRNECAGDESSDTLMGVERIWATGEPDAETGAALDEMPGVEENDTEAGWAADDELAGAEEDDDVLASADDDDDELAGAEDDVLASADDDDELVFAGWGTRGSGFGAEVGGDGDRRSLVCNPPVVSIASTGGASEASMALAGDFSGVLSLSRSCCALSAAALAASRSCISGGPVGVAVAVCSSGAFCFLSA